MGMMGGKSASPSAAAAFVAADPAADSAAFVAADSASHPLVPAAAPDC